MNKMLVILRIFAMLLPVFKGKSKKRQALSAILLIIAFLLVALGFVKAAEAKVSFNPYSINSEVKI